MLGLLAFALLAVAEPASAEPPQAASYGPAVPAPVRKPASYSATASCASARASSAATDIIVCAPRGYRLDPDVLVAHKAMRSGGRPTNPHESFKDHSCATIGPMGCRGGATINVVQAAATAVNMINTAMKGGNVGKLFITDPQPTEYQLYLEAKAAREAKEAAAAAATKAKAAPVAPAELPAAR